MSYLSFIIELKFKIFIIKQTDRSLELVVGAWRRSGGLCHRASYVDTAGKQRPEKTLYLDTFQTKRVVLEHKFVKKRLGFLLQKTPTETHYPFAIKLKRFRLKAPFKVCMKQSLTAELSSPQDLVTATVTSYNYPISTT